MVFHSAYADVPILSEPIHDAVLGGAAARGDTPALIDGVTGAVLSYAQLDAAHRRTASGLVAAGVRKGDVLALHSPNSTDFAVAFYGALRAGAPVTTSHPLATPEELARQLTDSTARWIITAPPLAATARRAAELAGGIREIFVTGPAEGHRSLDDLGRSAPTEPPPLPAIDPASDLVALPYSCGTTGVPKGVMLTHRNLAANVAQVKPVIGLDPGERIIAVLPFFHIYGLTVLHELGLRSGATVVVLPRFDLETTCAPSRSTRSPALFVAPPIVLALAKHPLVDRYDLSSLRSSCPARHPWTATSPRPAHGRLKLPHVGQGYGMTELSPGSHTSRRTPATRPPGTVGKLRAQHRVRICRPRRPAQDAADGERGELLFRGPQVMKGYLAAPRRPPPRSTPTAGCTPATSAIVDDDGWLYRRRPGQGADQVQGLPGRPRRTGGAAARPPRYRRRRRHRCHGRGRRRRYPRRSSSRRDGPDLADATRSWRTSPSGSPRTRRSGGWSSSTRCPKPPPARSCAANSGTGHEAAGHQGARARYPSVRRRAARRCRLRRRRWCVRPGRCAAGSGAAASGGDGDGAAGGVQGVLAVRGRGA